MLSERTARVEGGSAGEDRKDLARRLWASGSYPRIAQLVGPMGCDLVEVAGIGPGMRVLDVATGTGNVAIPAALAGAVVTGVDLSPPLLAVGRRRAVTAGVQVEWVDADAEDLPYEAESFDVVLSAIGAMFAPDHARTAAELVRVCRRGGRIALANWTPDGYGGAFFGLLARYAPPPPAETAASTPPTAWGDPDYLRELFADRVENLNCQTRTLILDFTGPPEDLFEIYRTCFGPVLAIRTALDGDTARLEAFDQDLLEFLRGENLGSGDPGRGRYQFEYLAVTATRTS